MLKQNNPEQKEQNCKVYHNKFQAILQRYDDWNSAVLAQNKTLKKLELNRRLKPEAMQLQDDIWKRSQDTHWRKDSVLVRVAIAMIKHSDQSNLERKCLFGLKFYIIF